MGRKEDEDIPVEPDSVDKRPIWMQFIDRSDLGQAEDVKYPYERSVIVRRLEIYQYRIVAAEISADAELAEQYKVDTGSVPEYLMTKSRARNTASLYVTISGTHETDLYDRILSAANFEAGKRPQEWFTRVVRFKILAEKQKRGSS